MPAGYRLPPIIENLDDEQKFEILNHFLGDIASALNFLKALNYEEGEDTIWDFWINENYLYRNFFFKFYSFTRWLRK